jgi:hypothetical protein
LPGIFHQKRQEIAKIFFEFLIRTRVRLRRLLPIRIRNIFVFFFFKKKRRKTYAKKNKNVKKDQAYGISNGPIPRIR